MFDEQPQPVLLRTGDSAGSPTPPTQPPAAGVEGPVRTRVVERLTRSAWMTWTAGPDGALIEVQTPGATRPSSQSPRPGEPLVGVLYRRAVDHQEAQGVLS